MARLFAVILSASLVLLLASCGSNSDQSSAAPPMESPDTSAAIAVTDTSAAPAAQESTPDTGPSVAQEYSGAGFVHAWGNLWIGSEVYYGPRHMHVGTVVDMGRHDDPYTGESFNGVAIEYPDGNVEWKDRQAMREDENWQVKQ